ncbi:MAG: head GIN domain-containing protein [Ginsengibacter sp.]
MKKIFIALFAFTCINAYAQPWQTIKGNGVMKKESRTVNDYTSLASHGSINVEIAYGNSNTIEIEADENLLPYINTTVEDGRLSIKTEKNVNLKSKLKLVVHVTMNKINSLQLSGSGNINGEGAFSNTGKTSIGVSGSGNIKLNFNSFKELELAIAGSGNMDLKSNAAATNISAAISGSGNIDCSDVSTNDVDAKISGSGNVKVFASHTIDAKISGSGNVFYKGNAPDISSKIMGSGKVIKM